MGACRRCRSCFCSVGICKPLQGAFHLAEPWCQWDLLLQAPLLYPDSTLPCAHASALAGAVSALQAASARGAATAAERAAAAAAVPDDTLCAPAQLAAAAAAGLMPRPGTGALFARCCGHCTSFRPQWSILEDQPWLSQQHGRLLLRHAGRSCCSWRSRKCCAAQSCVRRPQIVSRDNHRLPHDAADLKSSTAGTECGSPEVPAFYRHRTTVRVSRALTVVGPEYFASGAKQTFAQTDVAIEPDL